MEPSAQQLLNRKIGALGFTPTNNSAATGNSSLSVLGYKDNPDGTTSNYLSNGQIDTGTLTQNGNNKATFTPTISLDTLQNPQIPLQTPKVESSAPPVADLSSYIDRYKNLYQAQPQENQLADVYKTLFDTQSQGGRQAAATQAQEQFGYNARQSEADAAMQRVAELNDQITQARNLSREQYSGTDALQGFVDARTESIVRKIAAERDRQQAVAELAQGRADRALQLSQQAVDNEFADRTDKINALVNYGQYLSQQIQRGDLKTSTAIQQAIEAQTRDYERQQKELEQQKQDKKDIYSLAITAKSNNAPSSVFNEIMNATDYADALSIAERYLVTPTQTGFSAPTVKTINGVDMQWNTSTGQWEPINTAGSSVQTDNTLNQLNFLRDTTARILGDENKGYSPLYKGATEAPLRRYAGTLFTGTNKQAQLQTYVDTLRSNMLTLATDPGIKKFFGPQMSNADVQLMTAAGTTLRPEAQTPSQLRAEAQRIDDLLNRMQTAVKVGSLSQQGGNFITAPDGTIIQIVD